VESPSYFYSLSLIAQSDFLTCCARTEMLEKGEEITILPVKISDSEMPVSLLWRRSSIDATRAMRRIEQFVLHLA
jgi:DNA-binding transcriptional LysR family regulator